ncbi:acetyl esterase [Thermosporothrix hazakensis]|jgi:acetyl esterase|uniref:Acetyl esterase n=1 Tax=Thermosporothrix hazakensis TaxID=644383 RepID=A0A326URS7_THEHA|nr:alpha/beta hydrolase [Thermosporothrix hazakensis]PZW36619.1 acetyl esterase [Thermosporothrix hazakensis]GCE47270.1 putative lipase/esterase [Thermosporothrix hazakensis]
MTLDPQVATFLQALPDKTSGGPEPTLEEIRLAAVQSALQTAGEPFPVHGVEDRVIPGPGGPLPVRIYTPADEEGLPALIYLHGGGWVIGSLETHDQVCRSLANLAHCVVIAVDYRLAPEHPFPAALEDCYAAAVWVVEHAETLHIDSKRLAIGGDSAGGNLAAAVTLMAREMGAPHFVFQVLIYPVTDHPESGSASYREFEVGYSLTKHDMLWYCEQYLPDPSQWQNPYVVPLHAPDLSGLPPALVLTAGYDPVRDDGKRYADRLQEAGVPVQYRCYEGMIHSFFRMFTVFDKTMEAHREVAEALKVVFEREA